MNPFENLIHELGQSMGISLHPDTHESCLIHFPATKISIQIDLDTSAEQILIGTQIGVLESGSYRESIFMQAMRVNGTSKTPRGTLAFSEKNNSLILFQFLKLAFLNGEKLHDFLQLFHQHALAWKEALEQKTIPEITEETPKPANDTMFGLNR